MKLLLISCLFILEVICLCFSAPHSTFELSPDLPSSPLSPTNYQDLSAVLEDTQVVQKNRGRLLIITQPHLPNNNSGTVRPSFKNGFVGTLFRAYNEHRHLILTPDDVWVAITTAFGGFVNSGDRAEQMRQHFVDFDGKMKLKVRGLGSMETVDWNVLIDKMSELIEENTKKDTRQWLEPDFSTTTPVAKTVGQVVMMGVLKHYFDYEFELMCGLPRVTLEGTLEDWQKLRDKAAHLKSFNMSELTHWAGLLDFVLGKFVESYQGDVDKDFWGKIATSTFEGSGSAYLTGWMNVFTPFSNGDYNLANAKPEEGNWGEIEDGDVPLSAIEVPVIINDNGLDYETIFYGGHFMSVYNPEDNTLRPSLDWAIIDVTKAKPKIFVYNT